MTHICMLKTHGAWSIKAKWWYDKENQLSNNGGKKGTISTTYDNNEGKVTFRSFVNISNTITSPRFVQQETLTFTIKVKMSWSTMSKHWSITRTCYGLVSFLVYQVLFRLVYIAPFIVNYRLIAKNKSCPNKRKVY